MLHYAVVFFVIALIAALFGFGGIAASAAGIGPCHDLHEGWTRRSAIERSVEIGKVHRYANVVEARPDIASYEAIIVKAITWGE